MAAPAPTTKQKGVPVCIDTRPDFTGFMTLDFPENRKANATNDLQGSDGRVATYLWNDLKDEVTAKFVCLPPVGGGAPVLPEIGDEITELYADVPTTAAVRNWYVDERGRPRKAGMELLVECKLKRCELVG